MYIDLCLCVVESPGSGIRFSMPKRGFQPGNKCNPFQNYSNKRRTQQEIFESYRKQHQQQNSMQQSQQGNNSPQRAVQHEDMEVDRGRVPSPPPPPSSPSKENVPSTPAKAQLVNSDATGDWPPALKEYVSRAFASVRNEEERDLIQDLLKKKLTDAFNSGTTKLIDWDQEPLPHEGHMSSSLRPGLNFNHKNSRWGSTSGFGFREGYRGGRGRGHFQGRRRSPPGYRRPRSRSRSRSRSSSPYSRSSRSYSRSRSRSRSPSSRSGRRDRRRKVHGRNKFRDLGSDSESESGSRSSRSPPRRRSFVDKRTPDKGTRGRGRGAKAGQFGKKDGKKGKG